jgi:hypothetical protein
MLCLLIINAVPYIVKFFGGFPCTAGRHISTLQEKYVFYMLCPAGEYCCAGPGRCRIPVPRPPSFEQLPAVRRSARQSGIVKPAPVTTPMEINNQVPGPEGVTTSNVCPDPTMTRVAVPFGTPRADGQAKMLMQVSFR